jgi:hypothetical protein
MTKQRTRDFNLHFRQWGQEIMQQNPVTHYSLGFDNKLTSNNRQRTLVEDCRRQDSYGKQEERIKPCTFRKGKRWVDLW